VDLAVIAAFTAAGISLINVAITVRAASRGSLQQWRRGEVQPVVARILAASGEAKGAWDEAALTRQEWLRFRDDAAMHDEVLKLQAQEFDHWKAGKAACDKLRFEVAQLELVGHQPVREAARALLDAQGSIARGQLSPDTPSADPLKSLLELGLKVKQCEDRLIEETRTDLGIYGG
jgi:hypothetical protein